MLRYFHPSWRSPLPQTWCQLHCSEKGRPCSQRWPGRTTISHQYFKCLHRCLSSIWREREDSLVAEGYCKGCRPFEGDPTPLWSLIPWPVSTINGIFVAVRTWRADRASRREMAALTSMQVNCIQLREKNAKYERSPVAMSEQILKIITNPIFNFISYQFPPKTCMADKI